MEDNLLCGLSEPVAVAAEYDKNEGGRKRVLKSGSPGPGAEAEKDEKKDKEADNDSEQSGEGVRLGAGDLHLLAHQT